MEPGQEQEQRLFNDILCRMEHKYEELKAEGTQTRFFDCAKCFERCLHDIFNACMQWGRDCVDPSNPHRGLWRDYNTCRTRDIAQHHKFWYCFCAENFCNGRIPSLVKRIELHKPHRGGYSSRVCPIKPGEERRVISRLTNLFYGMRCLRAHGNDHATLKAGAFEYASLTRLSEQQFATEGTQFIQEWLQFLDRIFGLIASFGTDFDPDYERNVNVRGSVYVVSLNAASFYRSVIRGLVECIIGKDNDLAQLPVEEGQVNDPTKFIAHERHCKCSVRNSFLWQEAHPSHYLIVADRADFSKEDHFYVSFPNENDNESDIQIKALGEIIVWFSRRFAACCPIADFTIRRAQCLLVGRSNIALAIERGNRFLPLPNMFNSQTFNNRSAEKCLKAPDIGPHMRRLTLAISEGYTSIKSIKDLYCFAKDTDRRIFQSADQVYDIPGGRVFFGEDTAAAKIRVLRTELNVCQHDAEYFINNATPDEIVQTRQEDIYIFKSEQRLSKEGQTRKEHLSRIRWRLAIEELRLRRNR
eukprot:gb/GECG01009507.1/.p1 GENE.gb/GECG01009507.1/~~gb/GECG01009507.1/.p1  ORF type:complete len:528 (+),score=27.57 gb/GECG01009507.1/:1-1584(+)